MLQSMCVRTFLKWPQYFGQRAERTEAELPTELPRAQSPEEAMRILDRYKGALGG